MLNDNNTLMKWEYTIVHTDRLNTPGGPQLAPIWRRQYADGSTDWDQINKLGEDGWEMVNAFPVEANGTVLYLAFVFKRPKRAPLPPAALPAPEESQPEISDDGLPSPEPQAGSTNESAPGDDAGGDGATGDSDVRQET